MYKVMHAFDVTYEKMYGTLEEAEASIKFEGTWAICKVEKIVDLVQIADPVMEAKEMSYEELQTRIQADKEKWGLGGCQPVYFEEVPTASFDN